MTDRRAFGIALHISWLLISAGGCAQHETPVPTRTAAEYLESPFFQKWSTSECTCFKNGGHWTQQENGVSAWIPAKPKEDPIRECFECHGKGYVEMQRWTSGCSHEYFNETCKRCNGKGWVR